MKEIVLSELNKSEKVFNKNASNNYNSWIFGNIPSKKEFNAKKAHNLPLKSKILWLSDLTLFGSASDNLIFTEEGIFHHDNTLGDSTFKKIYWEKLKRVEFIEGNESFYFVMSENEENHNIFLSKQMFILSLNDNDIPLIVNTLNNICSCFEDKESSLLSEILELKKLNQVDLLQTKCDFFIETFTESTNLFHAFSAKGKSLYDIEDWKNSLIYIDHALTFFEKYEQMNIDFKDDLLTLNRYKAVIFEKLNRKNYALKHYYIVKNSISSFGEKRIIDEKIEELKVDLKKEFINYPIENKKFVVFDKTEMDLSDEKIIKVLPVGHLPQLQFPLSHPQDQTLYAVHPYKEDIYFPISTLEDILFREKIDEFLNLVRCLGATRINIEFKKGKSISSIEKSELINSASASRTIKGFGVGLDVEKNESEKLSNQKTDDNALVITQVFPSPTQGPYLPKDLIWYNYEPSWQNLYKIRKEGGLLNHKETLTTKEVKKFYSQNQTKLAAEIKALALNSKLDSNTENILESTFSEETVWDINIHFENITNNNNKTELIQNQAGLISENEKEYFDEFKFVLSENFNIDQITRKILNRLAEKLGINKERQSIIEKMFDEDFTEEEKLYISEVEFCFAESITIGQIERRFLEKERVKLNLTEERVFQLESYLSNKLNLNN